MPCAQDDPGVRRFLSGDPYLGIRQDDDISHFVTEDLKRGAVVDTSAAEETDDDGQGDDNQEDGEDGYDREGVRHVEDEEGEGPGGPDSQNHPREHSEEAEEKVFHNHDRQNLSFHGTEGFEEDAFLDSLVTAVGNHPNQDNQTGGDAEQGHEPNNERDLVEDRIYGREDEIQVNDGYVREGLHDFALYCG